MIIDFRVRPPLPGFDKIGILRGGKGFRQFPWSYEDTAPVVSADEFSMPAFCKEMDDAGIGLGVVHSRHPRYRTGGVTNEEVAEGIRPYADRLLAFGAVDVHEGVHECVLSVEHAVKDLGCRGIVLEPGALAPALYADDPRFYPVYERCLELNVPVCLSLGMLLGPDISYSRPEPVQRAARDFPGLQFIIAHASYPFVLEAAAIACVTPNVWLIPDVYMNIPHIPGADLFAKAVFFTHGERILYGSAYPLRSLEQSIRGLDRFHFPAALYEKLTYSNAARLLGL